MSDKTLTIKTTPMAFVKRLGVLEIFFAFFTFISRYYNQLQNLTSAQLPNFTPIPLSLVTITIITLMQVVLILFIFFTWYLEKYTLTKKSLTFSRTDIFTKTLIPDIKNATSVQVHQGRIASSFNYGTLIIHTQDHEQIALNNIPNPRSHASRIRSHLKAHNGAGIQITNQPLTKLLKSGEGQHLEYKASLQWDHHQKRSNKDLHKPILKNIAAFLNTSGGIILVGVNDKGKVVGLENDYQTLSKKNADGWENTLTMAIKKTLGVENMRYIEVAFEQEKSQDFAKIIIQPSPKPAYLSYNGSEEFYIRTGNSSQPLTLSQAVAYIQDHFEIA